MIASFELWMDNMVLERGRAFVEADSLDEAIEVMQRQICEGDYGASWSYDETLSCRILEVEAEQGNLTDLCESGGRTSCLLSG